MSLSRKHYQAIADIIKDQLVLSQPLSDQQDDGAVVAVNDLAIQLSNYFKADNSNFDRFRFLEACGL